MLFLSRSCLPVRDEPAECHTLMMRRVQSRDMCGQLTHVNGPFAACHDVVSMIDNHQNFRPFVAKS